MGSADVATVLAGGHLGAAAVFLLLFLLAAPFLTRPPFLWALMTGAGDEMARRLNRAGKPPDDLRLRGIVALALMCAFAVVIGAAFDSAASRFPFGAMVYVPLLFFCVSGAGDLRHVEKLSAGAADQGAAMRRAAESAALRFSTHLVAPVLYFCLGGGKALVVYTTLAALEKSFGSAKFFGAAARVAGFIVLWLPAWIAALTFSFAGFFVSAASPWRALSTMRRQARAHPDPNKGRLLSAFAGALGIAVAGPSPDSAAPLPWIGPAGASANMGVSDFHRARLLLFVSFICVILLILAAFAHFYNFS